MREARRPREGVRGGGEGDVVPGAAVGEAGLEGRVSGARVDVGDMGWGKRYFAYCLRHGGLVLPVHLRKAVLTGKLG